MGVTTRMAHKQVVDFCTASPLNGLAVQPTPARGPGRIRTCDARFRKPTLYPLSYGADVLRFGRIVPGRRALVRQFCRIHEG